MVPMSPTPGDRQNTTVQGKAWPLQSGLNFQTLEPSFKLKLSVLPLRRQWPGPGPGL